MRKVYASICVALAASVVSAAPSGLTLIPIADILKHREAELEFALSGIEHNVSKGYTFSQSGTVGLFDRFEAGYESDFLGHITYDVKLQIFESPPRLPGSALSVGIMNCLGGHREPYVVGRYDLKGFRLHGGYWNTQGEGRAFLGTDFPLFEGGSGSLETLLGHHGSAWASLNWDLKWFPGVAVSFAVGVPAEHADGIQHTMEVSYGFRF